MDANETKVSLGLREIFRYRDLFLILAYRDFRVRYAQTYLGFLWAFIQPLLTLLIFTLVFGKAAKVQTGDIPYPVFALVGMSAWAYFAYVMSQASTSVIGSQSMIKKIYFPRLVIPLSKAFVGLIDFAIALVFLTTVIIIYDYPVSGNIVLLPLFVVINAIAALAVGLSLSALTVRYRDFQHITPFLVQFGLYATPIAYPSQIVVDNVPEWLAILYYLNPMAGVVEGFRFAILGYGELNGLIYLSFGTVVVLFGYALFYFKRVERSMADIV